MAEDAEGETLLQIPLLLKELSPRLQLTEKTSEKQKKNEVLLNCANLVIVLLGLVTKPEEYLTKCFDRKNTTQFDELDTIITEAFDHAGVKYKGEKYENLLDKAVTIELTEQITYSTLLNELGKYLLKAHATPLGITFEDGSQHLVLFRKNLVEVLELLDPQSIDKQGRYPLSNFTLRKSPFRQSIKNIIFFKGPILPEEKKHLAQSTLSEAIMHLTKEGGKRKTRRHKKRRKTRSG